MDILKPQHWHNGPGTITDDLTTPEALIQNLSDDYVFIPHYRLTPVTTILCSSITTNSMRFRLFL
jgi:hypothetical protein